jgi:hypothetical protein
MEQKNNSVTSAGTNDDSSNVAYLTTSSPNNAKPYVSGSFSYKDMIGFAHFLRNGLTNMEYCKKEHEEHLEYWCQNYR